MAEIKPRLNARLVVDQFSMGIPAIDHEQTSTNQNSNVRWRLDQSFTSCKALKMQAITAYAKHLRRCHCVLHIALRSAQVNMAEWR